MIITFYRNCVKDSASDTDMEHIYQNYLPNLLQNLRRIATPNVEGSLNHRFGELGCMYTETVLERRMFT
jgi:hypothetical protein